MPKCHFINNREIHYEGYIIHVNIGYSRNRRKGFQCDYMLPETNERINTGFHMTYDKGLIASCDAVDEHIKMLTLHRSFC